MQGVPDKNFTKFGYLKALPFSSQTMSRSELSLQERFSPGGRCFGCGPANPDGLRLRSFVQEQMVIATWLPSDHHQAFPGMLNGGIIGTLLDCHSNWTAAWHLMQMNRLDRPLCTVTSDYAVKLLRPTPLAEPVELRASVIEASSDRATVEAQLISAGKPRATSSMVG
jgi:acyl-coenzyme A thioesterase PaaI-like protein